ncbi:nuclear transport factor 2 family protein [Nesterenkonia xinjiangensis]|uniref:Ketosteroid isomerase-like protein n=1 Tax=Nesterenkonia xinjiangensis TaxID=225327 RepID=A0A7Z0GML7_9MICC|nr:nuclear transport factor 2 family protein [Nesterenkonia xinjiangensis]NYJ78780.1 ketosteroid isomerase-like protein [Nesterenkonia xinjiangensis]
MPDVPEPVGSFIAAVNRHDEPSFLAAFGEDGVVDDFGRIFTGPDEIKAWSDVEFIGARGTMDLESIEEKGDTVTVIADWRSNHANGRSEFTFTVDGERLRAMRIRGAH